MLLFNKRWPLLIPSFLGRLVVVLCCLVVSKCEICRAKYQVTKKPILASNDQFMSNRSARHFHGPTWIEQMALGVFDGVGELSPFYGAETCFFFIFRKLVSCWDLQVVCGLRICSEGGRSFCKASWISQILRR